MHLPSLLLMLLILPLPVQAATVWLSNGDRLSGDIIALDGGKLAVKTRYAGQVLIDWKDIDTLSSEAPLLIRRDGLDSEYSQQLAAAGTGMVRVVGDDTQTVPLASITRLVPPRPLFKDRVWQGNLDAKVDIKREQEALSLTPEDEQAELAAIYQSRGLSAETAATVARELSALDPLADPEVKAAIARTRFEMLVGFQLTEAQLKYNATR